MYQLSTRAATFGHAARRRLTVAGVVLLTLAVCARAASAAKRHRRAHDPGRSWIEGKDLFIFRYGSRRVPADAIEFDRGLTKGWERGLLLPDLDRAVEVEAATYPRMRSLRIDLSEAEVDEESDAQPLRPTDRRLIGRAVRVERFELVSRPLHSGRARLNFGVAASDVRLDFGNDKAGRPVLLMTDAKEGQLEVELTHADAEAILLAGAREAAAKHGIRVYRVRLKLTSDEGRSVRVDLKVDSLVGGVVPAGLRFRARLDIDDDLNGRLSELSCSGDNVLGPLISSLIRPGLKKHNGTSRPLIRFPLNTIRLRDVRIDSGETVRLTATFGS